MAEDSKKVRTEIARKKAAVITEPLSIPELFLISIERDDIITAELCQTRLRVPIFLDRPFSDQYTQEPKVRRIDLHSAGGSAR
jgi:hypothetical protein